MIVETYIQFNTTVGRQQLRDIAVRLLDIHDEGCIYFKDDCVDFVGQSRMTNAKRELVYGKFE